MREGTAGAGGHQQSAPQVRVELRRNVHAGKHRHDR